MVFDPRPERRQQRLAAAFPGRTVAELFTYIRTMMPKNDPGSLADEDYAALLAYLLQANQMPAGRSTLVRAPATFLGVAEGGSEASYRIVDLAGEAGCRQVAGR